jgi:predicted transcriptional regulator
MIDDSPISLTEKEYSIINMLQSLGLPRTEATAIVCLKYCKERRSHHMELISGLRQPEVSVAMHSLKEKGWVDERSEKQNKGKGRPVKYYQLTVPFPHIIQILEEEFLKGNYEKEIALRRLRELTPYYKTESRELAMSVLPDHIL